MTDAIDLNSPEVKAAIQAAIEEATAGLTAKNTELLGKLKAAKKGAEIDPQTVTDLEAQVDKLQADLATATKATKEATKAAETATKQLEAETGFTQKLLIDNGLLETLGKHGVTDPAYQKAAVAMLRSGVQVVADGENRVAKYGDKPLADYVKEWSASDEGKRFVAAPNNSGGNANGGATNTNAKQLSRADFDKKDPTEQMAHIKGGGTVID